MVYEQWFTLLFRFINSGIIVAIGVHVAKKYVYPALVQGYDDDRRELINLDQTVDRLHEVVCDEKIAIAHDQEQYEQLKTKINTWYEACKASHAQAVQDREMREQKIGKQLRDQALYVAQARLMRQVKPQIIESVRKQLMHAASDEKKAHGMVEYIVHAIGRVDHDTAK